jgi:uncharacterized MnhB-related membrane protein
MILLLARCGINKMIYLQAALLVLLASAILMASPVVAGIVSAIVGPVLAILLIAWVIKELKRSEEDLG